MVENCIFCKIAKGESPASIVGESPCCLAFLDIHPVNKGHILVIPKEHYVTFLDLPDSVLQDAALFIKKISKALCEGLENQYFSIFQRNGKIAGQEIPHLHFHILPRFKEDKLRVWGGRVQYKEGETRDLISKIQNHL